MNYLILDLLVTLVLESSLPGGDGDKGRLGDGDKESRLVPECTTALINDSICHVACGHNLTVALTTSGQVYTMGSTAY
jgi:alpha-tubulin suppressor-like RCC1 family protein